MADFDAELVKGPKEIWNAISPGYSDVLGIVGSRETTPNIDGSGVETSL